MSIYNRVFLFFTFLGFTGFISIYGQSDSTERKPNIVLILVDDSGLMDFGAFGGEARTP